MYKLCASGVLYSQLLNSQNLIINVFIYITVIGPHFLRQYPHRSNEMPGNYYYYYRSHKHFWKHCDLYFQFNNMQNNSRKLNVPKECHSVDCPSDHNGIFDVFEKRSRNWSHLQQIEDEIYVYPNRWAVFEWNEWSTQCQHHLLPFTIFVNCRAVCASRLPAYELKLLTHIIYLYT